MATDDIDHKSTVILSPEELKLGMYVSHLDRPWTDSQFKFQGFEIKTEDELKKLRESCDYVFVHVDPDGSASTYMEYTHQRSLEKAKSSTTLSFLVGQASYAIACTTEDEFPAAKEALAQFRAAVVSLYRAARAAHALEITELSAAAGPLVDSIERNHDALLYLVHRQKPANYLFRHAVSCAVICAAFGRQLGFKRELVENLAIGGALMDIGKTRIPEELLERPSILASTSGELHQLKMHVIYGQEIVSRIPENSPYVMDMVRFHHERHGGNGYPEGLAGKEIPVAGRIAGMVDLFNAMTSQRNYGRRATLYEASKFIRSRKEKDFDPELATNFQRAFGTYPTGSLVELDNGYVGFVIQQAPVAMLTPRIQLLLDSKKNRITEYRTLNLGEGDLTAGGAVPSIIGSLKSGTYGIDY
jgi:HD-GYP domain-containing protein (c-di-GMP phosphodiesterase class II)